MSEWGATGMLGLLTLKDGQVDLVEGTDCSREAEAIAGSRCTFWLERGVTDMLSC